MLVPKGMCYIITCKFKKSIYISSAFNKGNCTPNMVNVYNNGTLLLKRNKKKCLFIVVGLAAATPSTYVENFIAESNLVLRAGAGEVSPSNG